VNPLTAEPSYTQIGQVKLSLSLAWRLLPSPLEQMLVAKIGINGVFN